MPDRLNALHATVHRSGNGTTYLREAGVVLVARPQVDLAALGGFLDGFDPGLGFGEYLDDPSVLEAGAQVCKLAGQTCYLSYGPRRTRNADAGRYLRHILESGHGSVLEHANYGFLMYGVSRNLTHELVRHRAGMAYCLDGATLIHSEPRDNGRRNRTKKRTVTDLFSMQATPRGRSRMRLLRLRCYDEHAGVFTTGRVRRVVFSGIQPVFKVTLEDGKSITCTKEHRFLTPSGWLSLEEVLGGLEVSAGALATYGRLDVPLLTNGEVAYRNRGWLEQRYNGDGMSHEEIAALCGVTPRCIRAWVRRHGLQKPPGSWARAGAPWNEGLRYRAGWTHTPEERIRISRRMRGAGNHQWRGGATPNGVAIRRAVAALRPLAYARDRYCCRLCNSVGGKLTVHRILPIWARPDAAADLDNLATVCRKCRRGKLNGRELEYVEHFGRSPSEIPDGRKQQQGRGALLVARERKIIAVDYVGVRPTYDIEMEGENRNFVANGIVTHNSQVSQRYVGGPTLRFVERPEFLADPELHALFELRIDRAAKEYAELTERLRERRLADPVFAALGRTDQRKAVQQAARALLPNETEAPIVATGNVRAWRHVISMRCDAHAEPEIRRAIHKVWQLLVAEEPLLFGDYATEELPDGSVSLRSEFPKV